MNLFTLCLAAIPVLAIGASFQPLKYLNWIFVLLGVALGWLGTTMLYVGFVGGRWEDRFTGYQVHLYRVVPNR